MINKTLSFNTSSFLFLIEMPQLVNNLHFKIILFPLADLILKQLVFVFDWQIRCVLFLRILLIAFFFPDNMLKLFPSGIPRWSWSRQSAWSRRGETEAKLHPMLTTVCSGRVASPRLSLHAGPTSLMIWILPGKLSGHYQVKIKIFWYSKGLKGLGVVLVP